MPPPEGLNQGTKRELDFLSDPVGATMMRTIPVTTKTPPPTSEMISPVVAFWACSRSF